MLKSSLILVLSGVLGLASCTPPPPVPPPNFRPNPPYPPTPVPPYGDNGISPPPEPQPEPPPPTATGGYPTARPTANPNEVISPYEPYNVIDVTGFKTGQLARDPSNQKIFRVP